MVRGIRVFWCVMGLRDQLHIPVSECVERHAAHLVDFNVRNERGKPLIEVFIDNEAGVTSDLCASVSRSVGEVIDQSGRIPGPYRLEVSSPGIDRPLRFRWQFRKHAGRRVEVTLRTDPAATKQAGTLVSCDDSGVVFRQDSGGVTAQIPYDQIVEVRVMTPW